MLVRTNDFKEEIKKLGKQIDFKISLHTNDKLITQNNKFILTQDDNPLVVEQFDQQEVDEVFNGDSIYNASVVRKGNLLSTMMKEVDFEIREELRVGDLVDCAFGLKVGENYEYVNYGRFIIYSKEKNEDTDTYSYVAYDSMLLSMVEVDDTSIIQNVTVRQAIDNICNKVGLISKISSEDMLLLPNLSKTINAKAFTDVEMTYRDVLDMICQCLGVSMISYGRSLELKYIDDRVVDEFDEEYLKDVNVSFGEKYGAINSVALSRSEDKDIIYRKDDEDIARNGLHEFKIKDNLIMLYDDREDYIDEIYNQLKGLEFYINDFTSTGIGYLEWLDFYNVTIGENTYKCLLLNDEIKVQQGLEESIYTEQPEETTTDYKVAGKTDKEVSFIVDKQNGQIQSRVTQDDMESYVTQVANEISAEVSEKVGDDEIIAKLNLAVRDGQGIVNLVGNTVTIDSDKFTLDADGKIDATGGEIGGYSIGTNSLSTEISKTYTFTQSDITTISQIIVGQLSPTQQQIEKYDVNGNGIIDLMDLAFVRNIILDGGTKTYTGTISINNNDFNRVIKTIFNGETQNSIGMLGTFFSNLGADRIDLNDNYMITTKISPSLIEMADYNYTNHFTSIDAAGITTPQVIQTSLESAKKDFELLDSGLDIIKNIDIYKYHLKSEEDNDKKHIGFVIGENRNYSQEITSKGNNGADIYSFVSVCCKAIQEQQEIIEKLQKEVNLLKESDK